ncbi:bifunctional diaminohydroxyphosphoribosylaminopyrimidine deaminase/5-amino-6-(5-phosphoribosylamino)uracil reductase RibD [Candidatus Micrarchaeota archaeon]|nr:bifunctional diaminohydroxyphosphoribosylaminopyrimidine deaminase/5-amino-6-(5-phosphoribosylamino)uracil reductase RibD [Candidatus Micrarchaeota archaeon]
MNDADFMRHAISLAQNVYRASPNPRVGCVLVKDGNIIGKGFHAKHGGPHAEAVALEEAGVNAAGSTAFVSLEPCAHADKKTPPCAQALVRAGVSRVVVGVLDANPKVNGRGIAFLKENGVAVTEGVLEAEALEVNRFFFKSVSLQRPWVTLKMASTLDGKISSSSPWLSNASSRRIVQRLRAEHDAVLVGKNTVLSDDPMLSCRLPDALQPLKVVVDSTLQCPLDARVFASGNAVVACTTQAPLDRVEAFREKGVAVWVLPKCPQGVDLEALVKRLGEQNVLSVFVEGGGRLASAFLDLDLVDEAYFFVAPLLAGSDAVPLYSCKKEKRFAGALVAVVDDDACFRVRLPAVKPGHDQ